MNTVLIIEDNEQNSYLARFILEKIGHRVESVTNGPDGIAAALRLKPDLILLDIQLPGMDGHQVAAEIRSRPDLSSIPILAVTSFAMAGDRERILKAGCTGYLEKPIDPATFQSEVERILARKTTDFCRPRVLVVDDVEANRAFLVALLQSHNWIPFTANDGKQALEFARRNPPDLIVTDILMPVMDGFALCREWRKDPGLAGVPLVFYTATYTDPEDESFGLALGAMKYLVKPMEPSALLEQLGQCIGGRTAPVWAGTGAIEMEQDEESQLRAYNAALIRKLEDKMTQLERANATLEQRVRERTSQLEAANMELQAVSHVGTWISERLPSRVLTWSAESCRIFGLSPGMFDRRLETFLELIHPEDRSRHENLMEEAWTGPSGLDNVLRICPKNGGTRWVHIQGRLEHSGRLQSRRMLGTVRDITTQQELQLQLRQAQKLEAVGQLAGGIAHDFNNLMTVVQANAGLLLSTPRLPEGASQYVEEILGATLRACDLSRRLLAFSKRQVVVLKPTEINIAVSNITALLKRLVGSRIRIVESLAEGLPCAMADVGMLEQVILNLVVNARDAMPFGGEIHIQTSLSPSAPPGLLPDLSPAGTTAGPCICLAVSDEGTGIAPEHMPHIFEPFFTTKPTGRGSGLGLATVYGIIRQHGGGIMVEPGAGRGTTFKVFIPSTPGSSVSPVEESLKTIPSGSERILVVEDEPSIQLAIRTVLQGLGYSIIEAGSADEALILWKTRGEDLDLVLTDLILPGEISGYELVEQLRALHPNLKVILTSGHSFRNESLLSSRPGTFLLRKPFGMEQLALAVRMALDS